MGEYRLRPEMSQEHQKMLNACAALIVAIIDHSNAGPGDSAADIDLVDFMKEGFGPDLKAFLVSQGIQCKLTVKL